MKDLKLRVREILEQHGGTANKFKNFMSMRNWWERNYPDVAHRLFEEYDRCNEIYSVSIGKFLKSFAFDADTGVCYDYTDIFTGRSPEHLSVIVNRSGPNTCDVARSKIIKAKEICDGWLGYKTRSIQELKYCLINKIEKLPTCQTCGGAVDFHCAGVGFRKFCSAKCQNIYHNS